MLNSTSLSTFFINDGLSISEAVNRYTKRRHEFLNKCTSLTVLSGITTPISQYNPWLYSDANFYQEPNVLYFTGLNQLHTAIMFNPFNNKITLFLPAYDAKKIFWEGHFCGLNNTNKSEILSLFNVDDVDYYDNLFSKTHQILSAQPDKSLQLFWYTPTPNSSPLSDCNDNFKEKITLYLNKKNLSYSLKNCQPLLQDRPILDSVDIENLTLANTYSANIFKQLCKKLSTFSSENDVASFIKGHIIKASWLGESFPAIVACGAQAAILHYKSHNQPLEKDRLLLLDFGCRVFSMPADISRTIPVNGSFNPLQRLLYNIVLSAQRLVESTAKVGTTINDLNHICWSHIESELERTFFKKGGQATRPYKVQPHNVSHLIGIMVHDGDPFRSYRSQPLKPGMVISNEPGLYGEFSITLHGIYYKETIGIRIEDNLLITKTGCQNLSEHCPKTIEDIEALF